MILRAVLMCLIGAPALAQDFRTRNPACVPHVTVRHQDCSAITYYVCPGTHGPLWRSEVFYQGQPTMIATYDADYNTLGGGVADGSMRLEAQPESTDLPISLARLKAEGSIDSAETLRLTVPGMSLVMRNTTKVTMQPDPVTIAGMEFRVITLDTRMVTEPNVGVMSSELRLFLNDQIGYPIEGRTATTANGVENVSASDPVEITCPASPASRAMRRGPVAGRGNRRKRCVA